MENNNGSKFWGVSLLSVGGWTRPERGMSLESAKSIAGFVERNKTAQGVRIVQVTEEGITIAPLRIYSEGK